MKVQNNFKIILITILIVLGFLFISKEGPLKSLKIQLNTYKDADYPLTFSYKVGNNGYVFFEDQNFVSLRLSEPDLLRILVLVPYKENEALLKDIANNVSREGPTQMTFFLINNEDKLTLSDWLSKSQLSNFGQKVGEVTKTNIDGISALVYRSDGLYTNETVVLEHDSYIYVFNVSFNSSEDSIYKDFQRLINTLDL